MTTENIKRVMIVPPEARGVKVMQDYFREVGYKREPLENYRLRFMVTAPMTVRCHRQVGGEAGLEVGRVSEGALDVALNILNYYVPPAADEREMVRLPVNFASATAYELHEKFCKRYLAEMDPAGGVIADEEIMCFIEQGSRTLEGPDLVFDRSSQRAKGGKYEQALELSEDLGEEFPNDDLDRIGDEHEQDG